jgi:hypothetical protein
MAVFPCMFGYVAVGSWAQTQQTSCLNSFVPQTSDICQLLSIEMLTASYPCARHRAYFRASAPHRTQCQRTAAAALPDSEGGSVTHDMQNGKIDVQCCSSTSHVTSTPAARHMPLALKLSLGAPILLVTLATIRMVIKGMTNCVESVLPLPDQLISSFGW